VGHLSARESTIDSIQTTFGATTVDAKETVESLFSVWNPIKIPVVRDPLGN